MWLALYVQTLKRRQGNNPWTGFLLTRATHTEMNCCNFRDANMEPVRVFFPTEDDLKEVTLSKGPVRLLHFVLCRRKCHESCRLTAIRPFYRRRHHMASSYFTLIFSLLKPCGC